jgi:hypothetical protein
LKLKNRSFPDSHDDPVQAGIETVMARFIQEGRWEQIILFSRDGLVMARAGTAADFGEDRLLEFSFSLLETVRLLEDTVNIKDIVLRGSGRKRLIFRFFPIRDDQYILAAVADGCKGYRRAYARLVKQIREAL